jgi:hypothetical protein
LRGEGWERVLKSMAKGITSGIFKTVRERFHRTPSPQSPPLKGGEVITHTK